MTNPRKKSSVSLPSNEGNGVSLHETSQFPHDGRAPADEQIRARAYELYLGRGDGHSDDLGDWLRAEREFHERSGDRSVSSDVRREPPRQ